MFTSIEDFIRVTSKCEFENFEFVVKDNNYPYLQIQRNDMCATTGESYRWHGRKWPLSFHMTESEVVQTCFLALMVAVEHEVREKFKWCNEAIFRPHFDIHALWLLSFKNRVSKRKALS